ncbi:LysR family transcriptional regulator [Prauserella sp. PE36]|uniref:LysR family transcriptional regulator n=1 Tax=Prauserella sp. PE36 TaxID=1504709 RepID=UPI001314244D|nr:LysR family transcriptional regulator [Prauserella sp. PE36]
MGYELGQAGGDARRLAYFLAVVDAGTLTRAAEQLHIAQPSLSLAIRDLEQDFGAPLFNRVGRRLVLNETGYALVDHARQVIGGLASARAAVAARTALDTGEVSIAAPASLAIEPLANAVARFRRKYPGVRVRILRHPPGAEHDLVARGKADLGLAIDDPEHHRCEDGLVCRPIGLHEVVAVLPPGSKPATAGKLTRAELVNVPLIVAEPGSRLRALTDQLGTDGLQVRVAAEVGHREAMIPLILSGVGAALLPWSLGRLAGQLGAVVVGLAPPVLNTMLVVHRIEFTAAASAFLDTMGEHEDIRTNTGSGRGLQPSLNSSKA